MPSDPLTFSAIATGFSDARLKGCGPLRFGFLIANDTAVAPGSGDP